MKNTKKVIAVISAVILMFTMAVTAFAAGDGTINYLVLGDSIGYGAGVLNSNEACFGRIVADTTGFNYKNDAVNGYRTSDLLAYLELDRIEADVADADVISLSICGNDFLRANMGELIAQAQEGDYSQFEEIAAASLSNFAAIIEKIHSINPDVMILAQTIYNPGEGALKDVYAVATALLNAGYRDYLAANPGAYELLEIAEAFEGHDDFIAADRIHPSANGNVKIAGKVLEKLNEKGLTDKTMPVVKNEGIEQTELFSVKFITYFIRNIIARIQAIFNYILGR